MHVGIDLGTTNTLVSYVNETGNVCRVAFKNGREENKYLLPSCIAVNESGGISVGQPALDTERLYPNRVLRNTKNYMGTSKTWMLGRSSVDAGYAAEMILSEVLSELKRQFPEEKSFHALVTVPARFDTQAPRLATKEALKRAGFEYDEHNALMDEPVAAAVAYSSRLTGSENILVVDLGGGTFDLSLMRSKIVGLASSENRLEPIAWGGDRELGGNDADKVILSLLLGKAEAQTGFKFKSSDPRDLSYTKEQSEALSRLLESTAEIKSRLYAPGSESADIYIPELFPDVDLSTEITAEEYESAAADIADRMRELIRGLYISRGISFETTGRVLVVGGMARERCLLKILSDIFGAEKILIPEEPLYLVARGAAICNSSAAVHIDTRAYSSIGVLTHNRTKTDIIINEGDPVGEDFHVTRYYHPAVDNAVSLTVNVVEFKGSYDRSKCSLVYSASIPLKKRLFAGEQRVKAEFSLDKDNLLSVSLTQTDGSNTQLSVKL